MFCDTTPLQLSKIGKNIYSCNLPLLHSCLACTTASMPILLCMHNRQHASFMKYSGFPSLHKAPKFSSILLPLPALLPLSFWRTFATGGRSCPTPHHDVSQLGAWVYRLGISLVNADRRVGGLSTKKPLLSFLPSQGKKDHPPTFLQHWQG